VELARALALVSARVVELVPALVSTLQELLVQVEPAELAFDPVVLMYYRPLKNITSSTYSFL
jgi:hypothetical protein